MASVCTRWKYEIELPNFLHLRKMVGTSQIIVVMAQERVDRKNENRIMETPFPAYYPYPVYRITIYELGTEKWCELPDSDWLPVHSCAIGVGSDLVVIGGWDTECWEGSKSVYIYNFVSGIWRRGADMPEGRMFFGYGTDSDRWVYIIGGTAQQYSDAKQSAMAYNVTEDKWTIFPNMRLARTFCQVLYDSGKIHVIGGCPNDNTTEIFDLSTWQWDDSEQLSEANVDPLLCVYGDDGKLYACDSDNHHVMTKDSYNWHLIAEIPSKFSTISKISARQGKLLIIGGSSLEETHVAYTMDLITLAWTQLKVPREYSGYVQSCYFLEL